MSYTRQQKRELLRKLNDAEFMKGQIKKMEFVNKERQSLDKRQKNTRIAATVTIIILIAAIASMFIFR